MTVPVTCCFPSAPTVGVDEAGAEDAAEEVAAVALEAAELEVCSLVADEAEDAALEADALADAEAAVATLDADEAAEADAEADAAEALELLAELAAVPPDELHAAKPTIVASANAQTKAISERFITTSLFEISKAFYMVIHLYLSKLGK